jgi:hypothetical protein
MDWGVVAAGVGGKRKKNGPISQKMTERPGESRMSTTQDYEGLRPGLYRNSGRKWLLKFKEHRHSTPTSIS